jgi:hypothetical protein
MLLVAALVVGGVLAVAAGVGNFIRRDETKADVLPNVCQLVALPAISAILHAPVTLKESSDSGPSASGPVAFLSCGYSYPPGDGTLIVRNLGISVTRPVDPSIDWARLRNARGAEPVDGLGDEAVLIPPPFAAPTIPLYVLKAPYVVSVYYLNGGGQSISDQQMENIARLVLAQL